jgi:hypothetical protein
MPPAELLTCLRRRPFEPFRIVTSDGTTCEVRHPDMVIVGIAAVHLGYANESGLATRIDIVATRHIVRLEEMVTTEGSVGQ